MGKSSSQEIESQYNLIKMILTEPEKYKDAIEAIKKDIKQHIFKNLFSMFRIQI